ncbi:MAG: AraC family transcriptional regulator [Clostridia bacterium]|nr:AraC family transcriptional regulator [Clostridia bacterium]
MKRFITQKYGRLNYAHSYNQAPDPKSFERHSHSGFELIYVVRGEGNYIVEGMEYPLLPNTVLLLRPYEYHYVCPKREHDYERYVIHFSNDILLDASNELSILSSQKQGMGVYFPQEAVSEEITSQFRIIDYNFISDTEISPSCPTRAETILRTSINQILLLLSFLKPDKPKSHENDWVSNVMQYLNQNLKQEITLEEVARHFFVSKYHLCHAFRAQTGISVFSYLTTKRIAHAEQLLEDGSPATEVAELVGFRDYSVFYRAYRKITGKSPSNAKRTPK